MRSLKKFCKLIYPIGYVLAVLSVNPMQMRNLTIGMLMMLPHVFYLIMEEIVK